MNDFEPEWCDLYRSERRERIAKLKEILGEENERFGKREKELLEGISALKSDYESKTDGIDKVKECFSKELELRKRFISKDGRLIGGVDVGVLGAINELTDFNNSFIENHERFSKEIDRLTERILDEEFKIVSRRSADNISRESGGNPFKEVRLKLSHLIGGGPVMDNTILEKVQRNCLEAGIRIFDRMYSEEECEYKRRNVAMERDKKELKANYRELRMGLLRDAARDNVNFLLETCETFGKREYSDLEMQLLDNLQRIEGNKAVDEKIFNNYLPEEILGSIVKMEERGFIDSSHALKLGFGLLGYVEVVESMPNQTDKKKEEKRVHHEFEGRILGEKEDKLRETRVLISGRALERARKDSSIYARWDRFAGEIEKIKRDPMGRPREKILEFFVSPRGGGTSAAPRIAWQVNEEGSVLIYDLLYHVGSSNYVDNWNGRVRSGEVRKRDYEESGFEDYTGQI